MLAPSMVRQRRIHAVVQVQFAAANAGGPGPSGVMDQLSNSAASSASSEAGPASMPALCRRVRGSRRWK